MRLRILIVALVMVLGACKSAPPGESSTVELYERLCSNCHGIQGQGDGPVAPLINIRVPDLTRIAERNGGEFPAEDVRRTIDGRVERRAHGTRTMPVWGWEFYSSTTSDDAAERARVDQQVGRLVEYVRSVQVE